ncbi:MAG: hypothetical protein F7C82_01540 [Desulfurococcales archaeon]|nr:hypothetical protein [Desulfurococcales archaeon]
MEKRLIGVLVIILIIAGAVFLYTEQVKKQSCNDFKIVKMCAMTNRLIVETQGKCNSVTMKFYDEDGNLKTQAKISVGSKVVVPLQPNLAPGKYRVDIYSGDSLIDTFNVNVSLAPYVIRSEAVAWPNGTIFINFESKYPACLENYGITAVIVRLNGTSYNVTGFWPAGEIFMVNIGEQITPKTQVDVILVDSFGDYYRAAILQPK